MASEIVYAIYHPDSGLFYTGTTLDSLGINTKLYKTKSKAYCDKKVNIIGQSLTFDYLEKKYKMPAIYIDIDKEEFNKTFQIFRNLKVVPINLEYNQA